MGSILLTKLRIRNPKLDKYSSEMIRGRSSLRYVTLDTWTHARRFVVNDIFYSLTRIFRMFV